MSEQHTLLVDAEDYTKALRAVAPFTLDKVDDLSRVRFLATGPNLYVSASNGSAAALAVVSLVEGLIDSGEPVEFHLLGSQAKEVASLFKPGKPEDGEQQAELRIDVHAEDITVTDAGGMFDGKQYLLPRPGAPTHVSPLEVVMLSRLNAGHRPSAERPIALNPALLSLVVRAAAVYSAELICEDLGPASASSSGSVLFRAGESLLCTARQAWLDETETKDRQAWRDSWQARLTAVGVLDDDANVVQIR